MKSKGDLQIDKQRSQMMMMMFCRFEKLDRDGYNIIMLDVRIRKNLQISRLQSCRVRIEERVVGCMPSGHSVVQRDKEAPPSLSVCTAIALFDNEADCRN